MPKLTQTRKRQEETKEIRKRDRESLTNILGSAERRAYEETKEDIRKSNDETIQKTRKRTDETKEETKTRDEETKENANEDNTLAINYKLYYGGSETIWTENCASILHKS